MVLATLLASRVSSVLFGGLPVSVSGYLTIPLSLVTILVLPLQLTILLTLIPVSTLLNLFSSVLEHMVSHLF